MRIAPAITMSSEERTQLESQARSRSLPVRVAERARIVLFAACGLQDLEIAARMAITPKKVSRWRKRFLALGLPGLQKDAPRPGRKPTLGTRLTKRVVTMTTRQQPVNATHWSTRTMAAAAGISEASVRRIWRAHGLKPHRVEAFKISNDPAFAEKLEDIVGLYLNPPEHALVLCADEKSQIQALDRTQPGPAAEARMRRHHDARLQTQRRRHFVCRAECRQRRGLRPLPGAASPSGMAQSSFSGWGCLGESLCDRERSGIDPAEVSGSKQRGV
jgi:transposase